MLREDGRSNAELRKCRITRNINKYAEGSCLISLGQTRVHCTASVEDYQPGFLRDTDQGWVTAEYDMLPRATSERNRRSSDTGVSGRTHEIQRLIGRSLRMAVNLQEVGERTIWIDCDVVQADGGTRTASITGAYVALKDAMDALVNQQVLARNPIQEQVAAVSVGMLEGGILLDLNYEEDSRADVDMNVIMTGSGAIIEVQGTAEGRAFSCEEMLSMVSVAHKGISELVDIQRRALAAK